MADFGPHLLLGQLVRGYPYSLHSERRSRCRGRLCSLSPERQDDSKWPQRIPDSACPKEHLARRTFDSDLGLYVRGRSKVQSNNQDAERQSVVF